MPKSPHDYLAEAEAAYERARDDFDRNTPAVTSKHHFDMSVALARTAAELAVARHTLGAVPGFEPC